MFGFHRHKDEDEVWLNISNRTIIRVLILTLLSFILLIALRRASHAFLLIFIAFFLTLALNAPVHWLAEHVPGKRRGSRAIATAVSFLIVVILLGTFITFTVPPLYRQTNNFITAVPHLVQEARDQKGAIGNFVRKYKLQNEVTDLSKQLGDRLKNATGSAISTVSALTTSIFSILAILVLTFMMLIEGPHWVGQFRRLLSPEHRKHTDTLARDMYGVIKGYVNGQVLLAVIATALISPALFILHVSYAAALIVIIFICALIPLVGHTIGAVIVTIVALFHSVPSAIILLIYYIVYQQIETYIIQPRIQANSTNLSPLLVFGSVIIGVTFSGLLGGLVAIPIAGCLRVLAIDYLHNHGKLLATDTTATIADTK